MIGSGMGSSPTKVYTTTQTFPVENLKQGWMTDMASQHGNTFFGVLGESSGGQVPWATSNPRTRNLASMKLQLKANFILFFFPSQIALSWMKILDSLH